MDDTQSAYDAEIMRKSREETSYMVKQHKREIREIKELLASGLNPGRLLAHMGKR